MTGYKSKRAAAQDKLAQPAQEQDATMQSLKDLWRSVCDGVGKAAFAQPAQEPVAFINAEQRTFEWAKPTSWHTPTVVNLPKIPLYTAPPQRPWQEPTESEWFNWWRVSQVANETEAEIDFADFLLIAQAVSAKLKEKNNAA